MYVCTLADALAGASAANGIRRQLVQATELPLRLVASCSCGHYYTVVTERWSNAQHCSHADSPSGQNSAVESIAFRSAT